MTELDSSDEAGHGRLRRRNFHHQFHRLLYLHLLMRGKYLAVTTNLAFSNSFLDFFNFDFAETFDFEECPASCTVDRLVE